MSDGYDNHEFPRGLALMTEVDRSMAGKVCMVTGATAGIGEVTARELARRGATVVVVGRNMERCQRTVAAIQRDTGNPAVEFLCADLSSKAQIRRLAQQFLERHKRLDVLVNNVGAMFTQRQESVDGIEMTLALNYVGVFLLTQLLLDALKAAAPARIINVASEAHEDVSHFDFTDPQFARRGFGAYPRSEFGNALYAFAMPWAHPAFQQYSRTKLALLLFTNELARRLAGTGVTVNALHPGLVATEFSNGNGVYGWLMRRFMTLRGIGVDEGSQTSIYLATAPEVEQVSGEYFVKRQVAAASAATRDEAAAARLWQLSEEWVAG
jgi:NAD(P)-dependent dehydrogenase (short-subunit alcohol dehydrogenase family)